MLIQQQDSLHRFPPPGISVEVTRGSIEVVLIRPGPEHEKVERRTELDKNATPFTSSYVALHHEVESRIRRHVYLIVLDLFRRWTAAAPDRKRLVRVASLILRSNIAPQMVISHPWKHSTLEVREKFIINDRSWSAPAWFQVFFASEIAVKERAVIFS